MHVLCGWYHPANSGSLIETCIRPHPSTHIFGGIWFIGTTLMFGRVWALAILQLVTGKEWLGQGGNPWVAALIPPLLLVVYPVFTGVGKQQDEKVLVEFMQGILEARESKPRTT